MGPAMAYETIRLEKDAAIATITLDRPDAFNALSLAMGRELLSAVLEVDEDPAVRCVVLTGAGKAFCGGGDVKAFADNLPRIGALIKELTTYVHGAVSRLVRTPKPVLTAVNGVAAGGGLSLAMAGDLVLAAESARFTMAYSRIAATPDGSSTYWLPRLVGLRRAVELFYTNRVLTAREAMEWGLVTRVVPDVGAGRRDAEAGHRAGPGPDPRAGPGQAPLPRLHHREPGDPDGAGEPVDRGQRPHRGLRGGRARLRGQARAHLQGTLKLIGGVSEDPPPTAAPRQGVEHRDREAGDQRGSETRAAGRYFLMVRTM